MKLKNVSKHDKHFKLKKGWITLKPGEATNLPEGVLESETELEEVIEEAKSEKIITPIRNKISKPKPKPIPESKPKSKSESVREKKKGFIRRLLDKLFKKEFLTKTDLIDTTKGVQEKILKRYGLKNNEIKLLKTESMRVEKILKLQDENS